MNLLEKTLNYQPYNYTQSGVFTKLYTFKDILTPHGEQFKHMFTVTVVYQLLKSTQDNMTSNYYTHMNLLTLLSHHFW